ALRRLRGERVAVLVARRASAHGRDDARGLDTRLPTTTIEVGGLSLGALHAIVVERLGAVLTRPRLRRLHELSRGNPFLALELLRATAAGRSDLDEPAPGGPDLARLVGARLDDLPPTTRSVLLIVAAASRPSMTQLLKVLDANVDVERALAPAVSAALVQRAGDEVRFSHPLIASSAYARATDRERRDAHALLAALADEPAEQRARHLALSTVEPDETVAAEVEQAANLLFRRGAPAAAAALALEAARLTPTTDAFAARRRLA